MSRKSKFVLAVCLMAQSFTSLVLSFVYCNRKKELSKTFLGLGLLGGLGGAYLLYNEYLEKKSDKLAFDGCEWCDDDDCDCADDDLFDQCSGADDINFTIAEDEKPEAEEEKKDEE